MPQTALAATLAPMGDADEETRGQAILRRMRRIGMTNTSLAKEARGMDRTTVSRAIRDDPTVTDTTYERLEGTLDRIEHELGYGGPDAVMSTGAGLVEFEVDGDHVIVKGPVADVDALAALVAKLIRNIRDATPPDVD